MILVYTYERERGLTINEDLDAARKAIDDPGTTVWIDLCGEPLSVVERVGELFGLNEGAMDDALDEDQRPRIDDYVDYLFLLLYASLAPEDPPEFAPRQLSAFLSKNWLITIHNLPIRATRTAAERAKRMPERALGRGVDYHLFHITDYLVDNFVVCAESYEEVLDTLDEASMKAEVTSGVLVELTRVQRELIHMRRMASGMRELASQVAGGEFEFISPEVDRRFDHIYQHLTHTFELIEGMRETIHSIRDNYYAILAERTNRMMRTLTLFSAFILPISLVTGFYGMNLDLWPTADDYYGFPFVAVIIATTAVSMLIYFRKRRWL